MKKTYTDLVVEAMGEGHTTPKAVFKYLDEKGIAYNKRSINTRLWEQRKRLGLGSLKATRNVGITSHVRNALGVEHLTTKEVFTYLDANKIKYNKPSVYRIIWRERKKFCKKS